MKNNISIWGHLQGVKIESNKFRFETCIWIEAKVIFVFIHFHYLTKLIKTMISVKSQLKLVKKGFLSRGKGFFSHSSYNTKVSSHD